MDFSNELLIDVGLNAVGYLAAGAFAIVIYRIFGSSPRVAGESSDESCTTDESAAGTEALSDSEVEFVAFGHSDENDAAGNSGTRPQRRNRETVIRLARKMIQSGTPGDKIRDLLPISEAELALLNTQK